MPHITFPLADLRALADAPELSLEDVDRLSVLVKGEYKARHSSEAEVKVELQDTNRPDTWCVEGLARQLRVHAGQSAASYPFFAEVAVDPAHTIEVDPSVEGVRPYVAGFFARGYTVDEAGLRAFIDVQEVLCKNYGRQRKAIAIGVYDASSMQLPVRYEAVPLDSTQRAFRPLRPTGGEGGEVHDGAGQPIPAGRWEEPWTPARILADHPTGREYAPALEGAELAPILVDHAGDVLSFPPIINSAGLGRVTAGMDHLFVEVTGKSLDQVLLTANILAVNLADRGAEVLPVVTRYPFDTPRGREVRAPHPLSDRRTVEVPLAQLHRLLGEPDLALSDVPPVLERFGVEARIEGQVLQATAPAWRLDYLHAVDAIEDFAISRGYESFSPLMPAEFTVGGLNPRTELADDVRDVLIGCGYEEAIGNILTAEDSLRARCNLGDGHPGCPPLHGGDLVRIKNVMNRNYAVLRDWLLPTLLEIERSSSGALFPHRVFEAGEVAVWDATQNLSHRTEQRLAACLCHEKAGFSEIQQALAELLADQGLVFAAASGEPADGTYQLEVREHPTFIDGRAAWIRARRGERTLELGIVGEVHPAVLDAWGIYFPVAAFEVRLDELV
jgi:phenylalanyl-tRNA synthetase beta chain